MNKLIDFIKLCLSVPIFPISWGIGNITVEDNFILFCVNGSKYQGVVKIEYNMKSLKVILGNSENIFINASDAFYWLDQHIE